MGKSSKKAKSDRINALRKQYDAFLEEDKKRKERNEFILGRLDKMRYTTALVPARYKPRVFDTRPAVVDRLGFKPEFSPIHDYQTSNTNQIQLVPDIQVNNNEDAYLIQEISKKYILIPKLRTTFTNNSIRNGTNYENRERLQGMQIDQDVIPDELKPNSQDSTDWKSKYEILKILKDEEKGKSTNNYLTGVIDLEQSVSKTSSFENNQDQVASNNENYINIDAHVDTPTSYLNEYPEKDIPADTLNYGLPNDNGYSLDNTEYASEVLVPNTDTETRENNIFVASDVQADAISDQLQNVSLEYKHSDVPNIDISQEVTHHDEPKVVPDVDVNMSSIMADDYSKQSEEINETSFNDEDAYPVVASSLVHNQNETVEQHEPTDSGQVVYFDNNEITQMEAVNYNPPTVDYNLQHEATDSEQVVYSDDHEITPMEAVNYNPPSTLDVNDHIVENENFVETPNIGVQLKNDAADIQEDQIYQNSNIDAARDAEPVTEKTENQDYVNESIEDFDAEQREMFYSEQNDNNYPSQHEQPLDYSQNEYSQNQEYAYYENTEGEAYPVELNTEEVTEKYDPTYEQQYTGLDQAAEQQQYVAEYQEPEQFTGEADHQFEELQYEQQFESQGNVEQTLDSEDGYTAQKFEEPPADVEKPIDAV